MRLEAVGKLPCRVGWRSSMLEGIIIRLLNNKPGESTNKSFGMEKNNYWCRIQKYLLLIETSCNTTTTGECVISVLRDCNSIFYDLFELELSIDIHNTSIK